MNRTGWHCSQLGGQRGTALFLLYWQKRGNQGPDKKSDVVFSPEKMEIQRHAFVKFQAKSKTYKLVLKQQFNCPKSQHQQKKKSTYYFE